MNEPTKEPFVQSVSQPPALITLGNWNFYFLVKFALLWQGLIGFHSFENLLLAIFILFPVQLRSVRYAKQTLTVLAAILLFYYDSWLPSIDRLLSQISLIAKFDAVYLSELAGRISIMTIFSSLLIGWLLYAIISIRVRIGLLVMLSLISLVGLEQLNGTLNLGTPTISVAAVNPTNSPVEAPGKPNLNKVLQAFFEKELTRTVSFPTPGSKDIPFDLIFIHVCSLSWDDVKAVGLDSHPLWKRFDFLFTRFNTGTSYSGPAAIRIQRANCGQTTNAALYNPVSDQCYLMRNLELSGFESQLAMNHDGHFDDFLKLIQEQHFNVKPMSLVGETVVQQAFDDAPIYDDLSVLTHWLDKRQKSLSPRVALYYNTVSLHDGNRLTGRKMNFDSIQSYKIRLTSLLDNIEKFLEEFERSGRRAVVAVVPEHGAAIQSEQMQMAGMREIPSSRVTLVPVGIKVIGGGVQRQGSQFIIEADASYLALTQIVANMLESSPYIGSDFIPADYVRDLPITPFVSQSESSTVMKYNDRYFWRQGSEEWGEYR
jgi:cellulose synthase operon protein YhjU